MDHWEYNVLNIYNWRKQGRLDHYFRAIESRLDRQGDICEAGVYQGRSLLATALFLKEKGSDKIVYGFDTFTGFPARTKEDSTLHFDKLNKQGRITDAHLSDVEKLKKYRKGETLSLSGDFRGADKNTIHHKAALLGLDNYRLIEGDFNATMGGDYRFIAALLDCDLYRSYRIALPFIWERLYPGGYVFLDEYYSLKFPGARLACDEFNFTPIMYPREPNDFERWYAEKPLRHC